MNPRPKKIQVLRWLPSALMLTTGPAGEGELYITFDDGPHEGHTTHILDVLAANDARASFFLLGQQVERHPDIVERIVADGHLLGNHSYDHPLFTRLSLRDQLAQIERTEQLLTAFDGKRAHRFRPPSGRFPVSLLAHFAARGRNIAYWSYDSLDYQRKPVEQTIDVLRRNPPRAGDVVLMHDDSDITTRTLETLLPEWRDAGLAMRALPEARQS